MLQFHISKEATNCPGILHPYPNHMRASTLQHHHVLLRNCFICQADGWEISCYLILHLLRLSVLLNLLAICTASSMNCPLTSFWLSFSIFLYLPFFLIWRMCIQLLLHLWLYFVLMLKTPTHLELIFINDVRQGPNVITLQMINLNPTYCLVLLFHPGITMPSLSYFKLPYMQEPILELYYVLLIYLSSPTLMLYYFNHHIPKICLMSDRVTYYFIVSWKLTHYSQKFAFFYHKLWNCEAPLSYISIFCLVLPNLFHFHEKYYPPVSGNSV